MDSGVFSQQSSLENSEASSESSSLQLTCTPTASGSDEPLEDYTKYNASLPPVPPTKVHVCAYIVYICMFVAGQMDYVYSDHESMRQGNHKSSTLNIIIHTSYTMYMCGNQT